jgi:opacity protein-like surface antigen
MKKVILSLILLATISNMNAQSNTNFSYSVGFPSSDFSSYICDTSFRGFSFSYSRFVKPNITAGVNFGWNVFYEEKGYDTYTTGTASLSGKQYRTNNAVPLTGNVNYYFKQSQKVNVYGGLGLGLVYNVRNTDMYVYTVEEDSWNFALQPEIGLEYKLSSNTAMTIAGKYYYAFESGEIDAPISYFALNLGFSFLGR